MYLAIVVFKKIITYCRNPKNNWRKALIKKYLHIMWHVPRREIVAPDVVASELIQYLKASRELKLSETGTLLEDKTKRTKDI